MTPETQTLMKQLNDRLAKPTRCGCGGEYAGHDSCADRALLEQAASALAASATREQALSGKLDAVLSQRNALESQLAALREERLRETLTTEIANMRSLPMLGATNQEQHAELNRRLAALEWVVGLLGGTTGQPDQRVLQVVADVAMLAYSDPHATAEFYRSKLGEVCNTALAALRPDAPAQVTAEGEKR